MNCLKLNQYNNSDNTKYVWRYHRSLKITNQICVKEIIRTTSYLNVELPMQELDASQKNSHWNHNYTLSKRLHSKSIDDDVYLFPSTTLNSIIESDHMQIIAY